MAFGVSFHQKEVQHLRFGTAAFVCTLLTCQPARLSAQTFVQLTDLGQSIGPRLSRTDTRDRLDRNLFGTIGTKVSFIDNNIVYQFVSDPDWRRIILGKKDEWVHSYDNSGGPGGKLGQPMGIDISARKFFYAADRINRRIFVAEFSPSAQNFVNTTVWSAPQFMRPVDVAWDGTSAPLVTDNLYVLDDSLSTITYWNRPTLLWTYGTRGSGPSQFLRPSGICVGKTAAANGGTQ